VSAAGPLASYLEQKRRVWPAPLFWGVVTAPALLLLVLIVVWALRASPADDGAAASAPPAPTVSTPEGPSAAPAPAIAQPRFDRFLVSADVAVLTCEDLIGKAPSSPGGWDASRYWKTARQALMQGNVDKAHEMMCRAVAKDPASPAAEGLASFYLARRGVGAADRYVRGVLTVDAERRTALELDSDVKNQQGKPEEALAILLRTARLDAGDAARRAVVSRKFSAEAELALKSGDLPLAERLLRRAVILSPQNDQATLRLAELFLRMGLRAPAKLWAEMLLQGPTKHPEAHMVLGDVARLDGDAQSARQHYAEVTPESGLSARAQAQLETLP
jgi:Tfp pilus assembly protein PilF